MTSEHSFQMADVTRKNIEDAGRETKRSVEAPLFLYDSIVVILVGPKKHRFDLHKGLLCAKSDYFRAAFQGNFKEAKGKIWLTEEDTEIFKYFVYWLYTDRLQGFYFLGTEKPTIAELRSAAVADFDEKERTGQDDLIEPDVPAYQAWIFATYRDAPFDKLIDLYILADQYQVVGLRDPIISLLVEVYAGSVETGLGRGVPTPFWWISEKPSWLPDSVATIDAAWPNLREDCTLSRLLIQLFCDEVVDLREKIKDVTLNQDFLAGCIDQLIIQRYYKGSSTEWEKKRVICRFHEHKSAFECTHSLKFSR